MILFLCSCPDLWSAASSSSDAAMLAETGVVGVSTGVEKHRARGLTSVGQQVAVAGSCSGKGQGAEGGCGSVTWQLSWFGTSLQRWV